jgi:subtilisin family serine protease
MSRLKIVLVVFCLLIVLGGCTGKKNGLLQVKSLPEVINESVGLDFIGADVSKLNLKNKETLLVRWASFDSSTKWPKLPQGFKPQEILEEGKNPGLNIKSLQKKGITGRGVNVGVIDMTLLKDHEEYKDRVVYYEEHLAFPNPEMHGSGVVSLLCGKSIGVAPDANVYYIATSFTSDEEGNTKCTKIAWAINRLLDMNKTLSDADKIKVISLSASFRPNEEGYLEAVAAQKRAIEEGVLVVSSVMEEYYTLAFQGLGRTPYSDPDELQSYTLGSWWAADAENWVNSNTQRVYLPMDSRTTASPWDTEGYIFYRVGGWSWVAPYLAGLYALGLQVNPDLTPSEFATALYTTGDFLEVNDTDGNSFVLGPVLNAERFIEAIAR